MKSLFGYLLSTSLVLSLISAPLASAEFECGEWDDVSSVYMDVMVEICEEGIMSGNTTNYFGNDIGINRAEAATVGMRIHMGPDEYNDIENSGSYYIDKLEDYFTDVPPNESWNLWILKAMHYSRVYSVMSGDQSDSSMTTYRPTDSVTTAEFLKILYESAQGGGRLDDEDNENISYSGNPWYEDVVEHYYDMGLIYNYDVEDTKFIEFKVYYDFEDETAYHRINLELDEEITRRDVAFIIYEMMRRDIMGNPNDL